MLYVAAVSVSDTQCDAQIRSGSQESALHGVPRLAVLLLHRCTVCKILGLSEGPYL